MLCPVPNTSELGIAPPVADTRHVLDLRKAGVDRQEFSPDPLQERADICVAPLLAAAGDEAGIMSRVVDGAVGLELAFGRHQQRHDPVFRDGQADILLAPQGARRQPCNRYTLSTIHPVAQRGCNAKIVSCITPSPNLSPKGERSMKEMSVGER